MVTAFGGQGVTKLDHETEFSSVLVFVMIERNNPFTRGEPTRFNLFRSDLKRLGRMKIRFHRRRKRISTRIHGTIRLHNRGCIRRAKRREESEGFRFDTSTRK